MRRARPRQRPAPARPGGRQRAAWIAEAARLLAEGHAVDVAHACRRAAAQLGVPRGEAAPAAAEVLAAVEAHRRLYARERHRDALVAARRAAREALRTLAPFEAVAVGAVVDGSAGAATEIALVVRAGDFVAVVEHLAARGIPVAVGESPLRPRQGRLRTLVALRFHAGPCAFVLTILPPQAGHLPLVDRAGLPVTARADLAALERLIADASDRQTR